MLYLVQAASRTKTNGKVKWTNKTKQACSKCNLKFLSYMIFANAGNCRIASMYICWACVCVCVRQKLSVVKTDTSSEEDLSIHSIHLCLCEQRRMWCLVKYSATEHANYSFTGHTVCIILGIAVLQCDILGGKVGRKKNREKHNDLFSWAWL